MAASAVAALWRDKPVPLRGGRHPPRVPELWTLGRTAEWPAPAQQNSRSPSRLSRSCRLERPGVNIRQLLPGFRGGDLRGYRTTAIRQRRASHSCGGQAYHSATNGATGCRGEANHPPLYPLPGGERGRLSVSDNFAGQSAGVGLQSSRFCSLKIENRGGEGRGEDGPGYPPPRGYGRLSAVVDPDTGVGADRRYKGKRGVRDHRVRL